MRTQHPFDSEAAAALKKAKLARKKQAKWWHQHQVLLTVVAIVIVSTFYLVSYLGLTLLSKTLNAAGISPSGVNLIWGTLLCALGAWGLRSVRSGPWLIINVLCCLGGIVCLTKAFGIA